MTENYKIPTLLKELGTLTAEDIDDLHYSAQYYVLQIWVPEDYDAREVARELNKHTGLATYCPEFFAGYRKAPRCVYVNVARGAEARRIPEFRDRINNTLYKVYGSRLLGVKEFLRAISACSDGCRFALQYDSMWDVWNAMVDYKKWEYLHYTIHQINSKTEAGELEEFNLTRLSDLRKLDEFRGTDVGALGRVFRSEYLKAINPFKRPEGRSED